MISLLFLISCAALAPQQDGGFDDLFTGKTLRFDYYHSGNATEEHVSLDVIRREGDWPGSRTQLIDTTNYGKFLFQVIDPATNTVIYSRGFASIYGEWETTGEAKKIWRTFHESQRFPETKSKCQLVLKKRAGDGTFREIYSTLVDPKSRFVDRSDITRRGEVHGVWGSKEAASTRVDLLILGDGYTASEAGKFRTDVDRMVEALFATEPFKTHKQNFNVWAIHVPAQKSGISNPRQGKWRDSPFGTSFNSFDSDRYVLTYANREIREIAAQVPYDTMAILCNTRKYGGGGIFNLYTTCASDTAVADYVFVHELGHSFAGLADEYYTSSVSYEDFNPPGVEPWEPNVTALLDTKNLKWKDLVEPSTPLPTPWKKEEYDRASYDYQQKRGQMREAGASEEAMEGLFSEVKKATGPILSSGEYTGKVGAFEGAGYRAKGLYRPEADCIMFTRNPDSFCRVCHRAVETIINLYIK